MVEVPFLLLLFYWLLSSLDCVIISVGLICVFFGSSGCENSDCVWMQ